MAFTINLYNTSSEPEVVDKSLSSQQTLQGQLKDGTSIIDPIILCNISNIPTSNYMYIDSFHRYYFIKDIKSAYNGLIEISAHVDVLMTYKSNIRGCNALIERQEKSYNKYLVDSLIPVDNQNIISSKKFSQNVGFNKNNLVLTYSASIGA